MARDSVIATTILSLVIIVMIGGLLTFVLFHSAVLTAFQESFLGNMGHTLGAAFMIMIGFWFGSSHSSRMKDEVLYTIETKKTAAPTELNVDVTPIVK